jgi:tRNA G18 (ribose-2'-O)-methylase SpoU
VLAIGRRRATPAAGDLLDRLGPRATVMVLLGVSNHDNVGGVFRNAAAFGADAVLLDHASCDPLYRKAIRVSVGAALTVPFARLEPSTDLLALLAAHALEPLALSPAGAERLSDLAPPSRAAVILGAEGQGLAPALLARSRTVRIPMAPGFDSLNVAVTSALVLHHLAFASAG